jgi:hypothetical protein
MGRGNGVLRDYRKTHAHASEFMHLPGHIQND